MGESFSTDLSTGVLTFDVPFDLLPARGAAQPALELTYNSGTGRADAGMGWSLGTTFIARQTARGIPSYADPEPGGGWVPTQDRFLFNGGQELVPICLVAGSGCADAVQPLPAGEAMPAWASGWQYFRARIEGGFLRFFWSPDHRTWRVQSKSGNTMELGVPTSEPPDYYGAGASPGQCGGAGAVTCATDGLEVSPSNPSRMYRWNIVREYDGYGNANPAGGTAPAPVNVVYYRYTQDGGTSYLSDVFDTPPAANPTAASLSAYAHHAHLNYEVRTDVTRSYRRGWLATQGLRLSGVDVTSEDFADSGTRQQVRRYHLTYDANYHVSLLSQIVLEGRCAQPIAESSGLLPPSVPPNFVCPTLPAKTFKYQHVAPYDTSGTPSTPDVPGFEGFDERILQMQNSPAHSLDETLTDLFDVNADGLPDVLVTAPYLYNGYDAIFFNGASGTNTFGGFMPMTVAGVSGQSTNDVRLDNPNVAAFDIDGDGIINLVNMPVVKTYSVYAPESPLQAGGTWTWMGRQVTTASQQNTAIDLNGSNPAIRVMDVNADGMVDVVFSSGTEYQTFFSLDRYPGDPTQAGSTSGDGQFGYAAWTSATTASISNDPVTYCLPWDATPALLSDSNVYVGDMNGDGLPDLVRVNPGDVRYWPGRGNGYWGTGDPSTCPGGTDGEAQDVAMSDSPQIGVVDSTESLLLDDVNGDGLDDVVKVEFETVYIWLNVDGTTWAGPHIIQNAPARVPSVDRMRLVDINGSGTRDILYGDGNQYRYMDVNGGSQPWVLTHVQNGLGGTTDVQYEPSTYFMFADQAAHRLWTSFTPTPVNVVYQVTESDNLANRGGHGGGVYVTTYAYHNAVYDGPQREFRGFESTSATTVGDANSPTSTETTSFLLGQCENDESLPINPCEPQGVWEDNPREALKGLPVVQQTADATGTTPSTVHHTYRLRKLYQGLDGREVRYAFESQTDRYLYDDGPFVSAPGSSLPVDDVDLELSPGVVARDTVNPVPLAAAATAHLETSTQVDWFGNATQRTDLGNVGVDSAIVTNITPGQVSPSTGWTWRGVESWTDPGTRDHEHMLYDNAGSPTTMTAVLQGGVALDRFYSDGTVAPNGVAPAPLNASALGTTTIGVRTRTYDPTFGVMTQESGPNFRCRQVTYDTGFMDLPVMDTSFVGAATADCTGTPLHDVYIWDRGLNLLVQRTDPNGEVSSANYDGFGRVTGLFGPDPQNLGHASTTASMLVDYTLPSDPTATPYSMIHEQLQDGPDTFTAAYCDTWSFVDGLGRTIAVLQEADPSAGDGGSWIVDGVVSYDAKRAAQRVYLPFFWSGSPQAYLQPGLGAPAALFESRRYDAFGRALQSYALDGTISAQQVHHALSVDTWDAADLAPGPHQGTPATVTYDGHGRAVVTTERIHAGGSIDAHMTQTAYLPTGEEQAITRVDQATGAQVTRWMLYDSLGRMVLSAEPDTTTSFVSTPVTDASEVPAGLKAWRYQYDDNGDLVGTSDARGCGENITYDAGGRLVSEDYSPCVAPQAAYTAPTGSGGDGTESYRIYDQADPAATGATDFPASSSPYIGLLASVSDRGSRTAVAYDGRNRVVAVARQLVLPDAPSASLASRYAPHWYQRTTTYDGADRPVVESTGVDVPELLASGQSTLTTTYSQRGVVRRVDSSYGNLVSSNVLAADALPIQVQYGDVAGTTTALTYDTRRRLSSVQTYRGPPAIWSQPPASYAPAPTPGGPPSSFQLLLEDLDYTYDSVDNPTAIRDYRNPAEWPAGSQPVTRQIEYDDLYRVTQVTYQYPLGIDPWTSPFAAEDASGTSVDPRQAMPAPHAAFTNRPLSQAYQFDWLGNTTFTDDDSHGFYDRSLGAISNGSSAQGPYQLRAARGVSSSADGNLTAAYDAAGNLASLAVYRSGTCLPAGSECSERLVYDWDEVGQLARARRWDTASPGLASDPTPPTTPDAEIHFAYDSDGQRTLKTAVGAAPGGGDAETAYVFDSLNLRGTTFDGTDYVLGPQTEVAYLRSGPADARLHYALESQPALASGQLHVLLELPDHLGSTNLVIDHDTSELVEAQTYLPYGGAETDYRPDRWAGFREGYGFSDKEQDVQLGLTYFGHRYLSNALGRWASPDPLNLHALGADDNLYAYVHGQVLRLVDATGLDDLGTANNAIATSSNPGGAAVGQEWTPLPGSGSGTKVFATAGDAQASGGKMFYRYDPSAPPLAQATHDAALQNLLGGIEPKMPSLADPNSGWAGGGSPTGTSQTGSANGSPEGRGNNPYGELGNVGTQQSAGKFTAFDALTTMLLGPGDEKGHSGGIPGADSSVDHDVSPAGQLVFFIVEALLNRQLGKAVNKTPSANEGPKAGCECGATCFVGGTLVTTPQGPVPIENIHVGDRVVADDDGESSDGVSQLDSSWIEFALSVPDPAGGSIEIDTLRPREWLTASVGEDVAVHLPELAIDGVARITAERSAPLVARGRGHVVLSTVTHVSHELMAIHFAGSSTPLEVTPTHFVFSSDRDSWIQVADLTLGERLLTSDGYATVDGLTSLLESERVYNLEVEERHTYHVTEQSVLVHNVCPSAKQRPKFWKSTREKVLQEAPRAPDGGPQCPTCTKPIGRGTIVRGGRTRIDYDIDHEGTTWAQRVEAMPESTPRAEQIKEYQRDVRAQCPDCNQGHEFEPK